VGGCRTRSEARAEEAPERKKARAEKAPTKTTKTTKKPPPPFDAAPLARVLRPGVAGELRRQVGIDALTDLPFYDMELTLRPRRATLQGRCVLHFRNHTGKALGTLPLLLHPNAPRELGAGAGHARLELTEAKAVKGPAVKARRQRRPTLVALELKRPLRPGERMELELRFRGRLRRLPPGSNDLFNQALSSLGVSSSGVAASDYGLLATGDGIVTMASAYPMLAPFHHGGFDTRPPSRFGDLAYNALASFRVRVTVPEGYTVVTNLLDGKVRPADGEADGDGDGKGDGDGTVVAEASGAANRDLVLVAGKALRQVSRRLGPVRVRSTFLERDRRGGQRALETAAGALELFQRRFGPYPYRELDVAEATLVGGAGGVEFPGMVLVAGMLYRKPSRSTSPMAQLMKLMGGLGTMLQGALQGAGGGKAAPGGGPGGGVQQGMKRMDTMVRDLASFTTAHEVAHQYFAGLVGSDCRRHPALDEPLAQYAAYRYEAHRRGRKAARRLLDTNARLNYGLYRMLGGKDGPAARPLEGFESPLQYAALV
jgi:hypothetical protein